MARTSFTRIVFSDIPLGLRRDGDVCHPRTMRGRGKPTGSRLRAGWTEQARRRRGRVYADVEAAQDAGVLKALRTLARWTDLPVVLLAAQAPDIDAEVGRLERVQDSHALWRLPGGSLQEHPAVESGDLTEYERGLLGIATRPEHVLLTPASLESKLERSVGLATPSRSIFSLAVRPMVYMQDPAQIMPTGRRLKPTHPERVGGICLGWLEHARWRAASASLGHMRDFWDASVFGTAPAIVSHQSALQAVTARMEQLLLTRDEIEWSCFHDFSGDYVAFRFDTLLLLACALLDQIASLALDLTSVGAHPMRRTLNPARSNSLGLPAEIASVTASFEPQASNWLQSASVFALTNYLYKHRNQPAHREPSSTVGFSGFSDRPNTKLPRIGAPSVAAAAKELVNTDPAAWRDCYFFEGTSVFDPLILGSRIVETTAAVARTYLEQLVVLLQIPIASRPVDEPADALDELSGSTHTILGA